MQCEVVIFDEKPSFSELVARAPEELHCHGDDDIAVEGVLHLGSPLNIQRKMVPIRCADQWEKYVRMIMNGHSPSMEVVVCRVLVDPIPRRFSRPMGQRAHFVPPIPEPVMDVEVAPTVPDAEFAPNEVVGDVCQTVNDVADSPHEILLTHNHPRDIPGNVDVPPVAAQVQCGDGLRGSNSVEIINDEDVYEMGVDLDSDDDRPVGEMTESDVEMFKRIFPDALIREFTSSAILPIPIRRLQKDVMMSS
ncbi:hypothetical protein SETIT_4G147800v2 [Setaria italica]|uniref:Uncharacterized protein n=1 Tax=Setaria italica TaxID=4555 RepID=A0A368QUC2_SETIT|nr:hypothetical protein SETIT_4G147800v2 [Setaria italica]